MTTRTIRALTILQPWAHLIVRGRKRVAYGAVVGVARLAGVEDEAPEVLSGGARWQRAAVELADRVLDAAEAERVRGTG